MSSKSLDIIMPVYNAHNKIVKALSSIVTQKVDFKLNVIIVDDGSKKGYDEELKLFEKKLKIKLIKLEENQGVGVARQVGIDNSKSDYIVFMDSDDCFYDCISLQRLYWLMEDGKYDYGFGELLVEENNEKNIYSYHYECLHAKIISRKLITENKIKFNTTRTSEDNSFNHLCYFNAKNVNFISDPVYIYKNNYNSLTRGINDSKQINNLCDYILNIRYVLDNLNNKFDKRVMDYFIEKFNYAWGNYNKLVNLNLEDTNKVLKEIKKLLVYSMFYTDEILNNLNFTLLRNYILYDM